MGIFTDLAIGGITQFDEVARRDTERNTTMANIALEKENKAFATTELAYKNFDQVKNIVSNNLDAFNIKPMGDFSTEQLVDMYVGKAFKEQRSIFENSDFNKVKINFANYVARTPGEDFTIDISSPYVASADKFEREKDKHAEKLTAISKTPRVDKLLLNLRNIDAQDETPVQDKIGDAQLKIASITAKGYGILNTFPGTAEGNANLNFMKVNIITANAKAKFPNDEKARGKFIDQKLYENNIDPLDAINYKSPVTYKLMSSIISQAGDNIAIQIADNMNGIARSTDNKEIAELQMRNNNLLLSQHKLINTFSGEAGRTLAGVDREKIFNQERVVEPIKYTPNIDGAGRLNLPTTPDGVTRTIPILDLIRDSKSLSVLPLEVQNYVNAVKEKFFDAEGKMIEPTREMFVKGEQGDIRFRNFSTLYNRLQPVDLDQEFMDMTGYGFIQSPPKKEKSKPKKESEKSKTFTYKGKTYNVPDEFIGQNLPEFLKKAIAKQQDKK